MINFDEIIKENIKENNPNWPKISDNPYKTLITWGSGSGKTNSLFNLINQQPDIDKIYWYSKDPHEAKYQFLINKAESKGLKHFHDSKAFIEYPNNIDDINRNVEEYNQNTKDWLFSMIWLLVLLSNKNLKSNSNWIIYWR